jgi:hypothetical protein
MNSIVYLKISSNEYIQNTWCQTQMTKKKTIHPNTPMFGMGLNDENLAPMEPGSIVEYICIKGPWNHWNSHELGMKHHTNLEICMVNRLSHWDKSLCKET